MGKFVCFRNSASSDMSSAETEAGDQDSEIGDSDHGEDAAVRIVSNLPVALREASNDKQAAPTGFPADSDQPDGSTEDEDEGWTDEDDDEDIDVGELAEDMAELEDELDQEGWGDVPAPAGFPDYIHEEDYESDEGGASDGIPHPLVGWNGVDNMDPDNDVGLYNHGDDELYMDEDDWDDIDDEDDEEDWDVQLGEEDAIDNFHINLREFQFAVEGHLPSLTAEHNIPPFWGLPHDESDDGYPMAADKEEDNPEQESFFSHVGQQESQWFHLSAASNHFQSADSLCAAGTPSCSSMPGSQDEEIVMLNNSFCLGVWRLPAASSSAVSASTSASTTAAAPSASCPASIPPSASASASASVATSAMYTTPATAATSTSIPPPASSSAAPSAAHTASSSAAASASAPTAAEQSKSGPHMESAPPSTSSSVSAQDDAVLLAFTYTRFRVYSIARSPDGRFIAVGGHAGLLSMYEVIPNPDHQGSQPPSDPHSTLADPQLRSGVLAGSRMMTPKQRCPLSLRLVTHIALESFNGMVKADTMANSVRFGLVAGKLRLLAACQNGCVYVFELGSGCSDSASQEMPCQHIRPVTETEPGDSNLHDPARSTGVLDLMAKAFRMSEELLFMSDQQLLGMHDMATTHPELNASWDAFSSRAHTTIIGPLGAPCNCAAASPDGKWVSVVGDSPLLHLLHASEGYNSLKTRARGQKWKGSVLSFGAKKPQRTSRSRPRRAGTAAGSQYCCWNSDSSLVAVSSDYYQAVMVFDVNRKQQVVRFEDQPSACLAVCFTPWDSQVLVFAEALRRVHITDLRNVSHARQRLVLQPNLNDLCLGLGPGEYVPSDHIRGCTVTPGGRLLIAHSDCLVQWDFLRNWVPEQHRCYPSRFKDTAKLLLLAAARSSAGSASPRDTGLEYGLHALPKEVLLKILAMAAVPLGSWMAGLPKINATEGMPEKPLSLEKLKEHQHSNIQ